MKTMLFRLLMLLMTLLFVGGVYWITALLDDPQKALAISQKIAPIAQSPYFIPGFLGTLLLLMFAFLIPYWIRSQKQTRLGRRLLAEGVQTSAQIVLVTDTGLTINRNPRVRITVSILNQEASFELTVSRVAIPRIGDWIDVFYDPKDPSQAVPAV